jgi:hypothetical protein
MYFQRNSKGSLVSWFLFFAITGLSLVTGLIGMELLVRWVSLMRVQNATNEAAMVYARDMVRLRDNRLSQFPPNTAVNFQTAGLPTSCSQDPVMGNGATACTPLTGPKTQIPGALNLEYLNASQILLYNVWGQRVKDSSMIDDLRQRQCYKEHLRTRFSLNPGSPLNNCVAIGNVSSPIMSLRWDLEAAPYGFGVCCGNGDTAGKDFCVNVRASGRMDPILAGGLPFLHNVRFIREGSFTISSRAVVKSMGQQENTSDNAVCNKF